MELQPRVLDDVEVVDLDAWVHQGGGAGLRAALDAGPDSTLAVVEASGLRGRGGAGFPTGTKWKAVIDARSPEVSTPVVVNAAEGEPGSFKDRLLLRRNPYRVLEGALIAATVVGSDEVIVATKAAFTPEIARLRAAVDEISAAGWAEGLSFSIVEGPSSYLYGEETALLEVVAGREPFPRIAPPWRRGIDDDGEATALASGVDMASPGTDTDTPPTLVNNVETLANLPRLVAEGPDWFRGVGTTGSPGTVLVTLSGHGVRASVTEVAMGTPLSEVLTVHAAPREGAPLVAAISGVSNPVLPARHFDTPLAYEAMSEVGNGLGAAGFICFDEQTDMVAVAHGVARFLAVESCGQCTPCKDDGRAITERLDRVLGPGDAARDLGAIADHLETVAEGARCSLAGQQQTLVRSLVAEFEDAFERQAGGLDNPAEGELVAAMVDITRDGEALIDGSQATKQYDWTHNRTDSGQSPADRYDQREGDR